MESRIKNFLEKLNNVDKVQYFLFYRFYFSPDFILTENYNSNPNIKYFAMNNNFLKFLDLCMETSEFNNKLDLENLNAIRYILFDTRDFIDHYNPDLEDQSLQDWCENKGPIGKYIKKYDSLQLWLISSYYDKVSYLYKLGLGKNINDINALLLKKLISKNTLQIEVYTQKYILPKENQKYILERILTDNYDNDFDTFLGIYNGHHKKVFDTILCNNEFLDICENFLASQNLSENIINNIIDILDVGIKFKTLDYSLGVDFAYYYKLLDKERLKQFDYRKARSLITLFQNKKANNLVKKLNTKSPMSN